MIEAIGAISKFWAAIAKHLLQRIAPRQRNRASRPWFKKFAILAVTVFFVATTASLVYAQDSSPDPSELPGNKIDGFPVMLADEELFIIQMPVSDFSAEDRVQAISTRLEERAKDSNFKLDDLRIEERDNTTIIRADKTILTITDDDAKAAETTRQELANSHLESIKSGIKKYKQENSPFRLIKGIALTFLATLALMLVFGILTYIIPKVFGSVDYLRSEPVRPLRVNNITLLPAAPLNLALGFLANIFVSLIKIGGLILLIAIPVAYITAVLNFFPSTQDMAGEIVAYINTGQVLTIALVLLITYYTLIVLRVVFAELGRGTMSFAGFHAEWAEPTYKLVKFFIMVLAIIIIFPYLPGYGSPAFQGISIFVGILVSLGSSGAASNIVSGIILIYTRAFKKGDFVNIGDARGTIVEETLLVTRVCTPKNVVVTIPNSTVIGSNIVNYSSTSRDEAIPPLVLHAAVTLGYDVPWRKVYRVLNEAARATEHILEEPETFVLQTSLDDFYVSYELNAYTDRPGMMASIYSELFQNIQDRCNEADIEILSPHYSAVRDGHQITIPENYLPEDYTPPAFRVETINKFLNPQADMQNGANASEAILEGKTLEEDESNQGANLEEDKANRANKLETFLPEDAIEEEKPNRANNPELSELDDLEDDKSNLANESETLLQGNDLEEDKLSGDNDFKQSSEGDGIEASRRKRAKKSESLNKRSSS